MLGGVFKLALFSIVIPTFNAGDKIAATLDSIRAQNFENLEIVVADGNSSDSTLAFLAAQPDIRWESAPDRGIYDAMNKGIAESSGSWLLFMGAGDVLRPGVLRQIETTARQQREKTALIYGDVWLCEENFRYGGAFSRRKLRNWVPSHQSIFYNRRVFERLGTYELGYSIAADYAFNLSCWGSAAVEKIYRPVLISDYEGRGLSKQVRDEAFERDKMRLIRERLGWDAYLLRRLETLTPQCLKTARVALLQKLASQKAKS